MFLILTGLILTFFVTLFIITSIIHKKQFAYNTYQDYNYPSLPTTAHATLKGGSLTLPATIPRARYRYCQNPHQIHLGRIAGIAFCGNHFI